MPLFRFAAIVFRSTNCAAVSLPAPSEEATLANKVLRLASLTVPLMSAAIMSVLMLGVVRVFTQVGTADAPAATAVEDTPACAVWGLATKDSTPAKTLNEAPLPMDSFFAAEPLAKNDVFPARLLQNEHLQILVDTTSPPRSAPNHRRDSRPRHGPRVVREHMHR